MTIEQIIEIFKKYPKDTQIVMAHDYEGFGKLTKIDCIEPREMNKTNNDGTFEALVIFPSVEIIETKQEHDSNKVETTCSTCKRIIENDSPFGIKEGNLLCGDCYGININ